MNCSLAIQPGRAAANKPCGHISRRNRRRVTQILGCILAMLIMLALKGHYSMATADQLGWILAPTSRLIAWLTTAHPAYESGVGYVDFAHGIIVAPACAGVNFMIMAFGLAAFHSLAWVRRLQGLAAWIMICLSGAYGYTLLVNTVRIVLSMALYGADIYGIWMTADQAHRLAGILLYIGALCLLFYALQTLSHRPNRRWGINPDIEYRRLPGWVPLLWYVMGTIGVPLAHALIRHRPLSFGEHYVTILFTAAGIWGIRQLVKRLAARRRKLSSGCRMDAGSRPV